jgi:hypothetical protein
MSVKFTALATAAAAALAASPAWAHDDATHAPKSTKSAQPALVKVTSVGAAMTVVRDAETGQLRAPTADEIDALVMAARVPTLAARVSAAPTSPSFATASGAAGLHLGEEAFSFSVARRNLDGSVSEVCVTGAGSARKALAAPRLATAASPLKELPNE